MAKIALHKAHYTFFFWLIIKKESSEKVNKLEFCQLISRKTGKKWTQKAVNEALDVILDGIADALVLDGSIKFTDYFVLEVREPKRWNGEMLVNPLTKEPYTPTSLKRLGVRCGKKLKERIQNYQKEE